jgi:hypothetical protein
MKANGSRELESCLSICAEAPSKFHPILFVESIGSQVAISFEVRFFPNPVSVTLDLTGDIVTFERTLAIQKCVNTGIVDGRRAFLNQIVPKIAKNMMITHIAAHPTGMYDVLSPSMYSKTTEGCFGCDVNSSHFPQRKCSLLRNAVEGVEGVTGVEGVEGVEVRRCTQCIHTTPAVQVV